MRKLVLVVLIVLLALPFGTSFAQDNDCSAVLLLDFRARASVSPTGATYGYVVNLTDADVILAGGSTDRAEAVEVHTMSVDEDDVMMMTPLSDGLSIAAGSAAELAPGGLHVMLIGLTDFLEADDAYDLALDFGDVGEASLSVPIMEIDSGMDMDDMSEDEDMDMDIEATEEASMDDMSDDMGDEMSDDMDDMATMGHEVSFSVLGECQGLETVYIHVNDAIDDMSEDDMDMGGMASLNVTLAFADGSEAMHELPLINAASMMDMGDMEMDG